jgi:hypothetical protein
MDACADVFCRYGPCEPKSLKERMKRAVALLGSEEVQDIIKKEGKIEVGIRPKSLNFKTLNLRFDYQAL